MEEADSKAIDSSLKNSIETCNHDINNSNLSLNHQNSNDDSKSEPRSKKLVALLEKLPELNDNYYLHDKVGEGTFSTVYLATKKSASNNSKEYAIKHLVPTSNPSRIAQEFLCMEKIGGKDNVVGIEGCIHINDHVVFIMPYLAHKKFGDFVMLMDLDEVKLYIRNLMLALRRVHSFNIIHRDVKPSNFIYNREKKSFLLVDFGLAEAVGDKTVSESIIESLNSKKRKRSVLEDSENGSNNESSVQPLKKRQALQSLTNTVNSVPVFKKPLTNENRPLPQLEPNFSNFDKKLSPTKSDTKPMNNDILSPRRQPLSSNSVNVLNNISPQKVPRANLFGDKNRGTDENNGSRLICSNSNKTVFNKTTKEVTAEGAGRVFRTLLPTKLVAKSPGSSFLRVQNSQVKPVFTRPLTPAIPKDRCDCDGKPQVCNKCIIRHRQVAPRAGTPGFRPPEVLLKYPSQTTAVDMWAAGITFLCILSGCYPFFKPSDDVTAIAEFMCIFGTNAVKRIAAKFGKTLRCSFSKQKENLRVICERLRRRKQEAAVLQARNEEPRKCTTCGVFDYPTDGCNCKVDDSSSELGMFPDSAYDLLNRLLDLDPDTRITAEEALKHPFLAI